MPVRDAYRRRRPDLIAGECPVGRDPSPPRADQGANTWIATCIDSARSMSSGRLLVQSTPARIVPGDLARLRCECSDPTQSRHDGTVYTDGKPSYQKDATPRSGNGDGRLISHRSIVSPLIE